MDTTFLVVCPVRKPETMAGDFLFVCVCVRGCLLLFVFEAEYLSISQPYGR